MLGDIWNELSCSTELFLTCSGLKFYLSNVNVKPSKPLASCRNGRLISEMKALVGSLAMSVGYSLSLFVGLSVNLHRSALCVTLCACPLLLHQVYLPISLPWFRGSNPGGVEVPQITGTFVSSSVFLSFPSSQPF